MFEDINARHIVAFTFCCLSTCVTVWVTISALFLHVYTYHVSYKHILKTHEKSNDDISDQSSMGSGSRSSSQLTQQQRQMQREHTSSTHSATGSSLCNPNLSSQIAMIGTVKNVNQFYQKPKKTQIKQLAEMFRKDRKYQRGCISSKRPSLRMFMNVMILNHIGNIFLTASSGLALLGLAWRLFDVEMIQKTCSILPHVAATCQLYGWCFFQLVDICRALQIVWNKSVVDYFGTKDISSIKKWYYFWHS